MLRRHHITMNPRPRPFLEQAELTNSEDSDSDMNNEFERRPSSVRMGRRFTLNPLIFAREERELRRQSLAQLKLSYYPKNANRKLHFLYLLYFQGFEYLFPIFLKIFNEYSIQSTHKVHAFKLYIYIYTPYQPL